jgi:hypothetical protein
VGFSPWRGAELSREQFNALTAPGNVTNVIRDGGTPKKVIALTIDGVDYTIDYAPTLITIEGSDGSSKLVTLNGDGEIIQILVESA